MNLDDSELTSLTWLHTINILPPPTNRVSDKNKKDAVSDSPLKCSTEKNIINKIRSSGTFKKKTTIINHSIDGSLAGQRIWSYGCVVLI